MGEEKWGEQRPEAREREAALAREVRVGGSVHDVRKGPLGELDLAVLGVVVADGRDEERDAVRATEGLTVVVDS